MPAIVSITVMRKAADVEQELARGKNGKTKKIAIPKDKIDADGMVQIGGGSGFIVDSSGIILTNKHVVSEPFADFFVLTADGGRFPAEVMARDPLDDIAILKIKPGRTQLQKATLGTANNVRLGETVLAFGNALGLFRNTVSQGIVSGLARSVEARADPDAPTQEMRGLIQTDAAINPGNSGGPLTDCRGRVIGITTAIISGAENISFTIPIDAAKRDLDDVKRFGKIRRPLLGVRYLTLNADLKVKLKTPVAFGAIVTREHPLDVPVVINGPADKAGITEHDIILDWNGEKITQEKTIQDFLERHAVGDTVTLTVLRNGKTAQKKVLLTERR